MLKCKCGRFIQSDVVVYRIVKCTKQTHTLYRSQRIINTMCRDCAKRAGLDES